MVIENFRIENRNDVYCERHDPVVLTDYSQVHHRFRCPTCESCITAELVDDIVEAE